MTATSLSSPIPSTGSQWSTPRILRTTVVVLCVGSLLLLLVAVLASTGLNSAVKTVGQDTAPSIIAAQHIKSGLADMDSNLANELVGKPGENMQAYKDYMKRRTEVLDALVTAAQNITFGDKERKPILTMQNGLADYDDWAVQSRLLHERGDPAMLAAFRHATDLMHQTLLPAADDLDKANNDALNSVYDEQSFLSQLRLGLFLICAVVLVGGLVWTQLFLTRRMNRLINTGLLASTLLVLFFALYGFVALSTAAEHLRSAKKDAFDSIHSLWQARALAYDANGEESRWLLDKPLQPVYEKAFFEKSGKVVTLPRNQNIDEIANAVVSKQSPAGFSGALADELKNITYPGEQAAATEMLRTYDGYSKVDKQIRDLENGGDHAKAVALCIGNNPGESNWAFEQFDNALSQTLDINQKAFDRAVQEGFAGLGMVSILAPIVALAAAGLALFGLSPRLREYTF